MRRTTRMRMPMSLEVGPIVERLGADALRWYLLRRCRTRTDSDVDTGAIAAAHDRDLADGLGNLVQRTTALAARLPGASIRPPGAEPAEAAQLRGLAEALPARVDAAVDRFLLDEAVGAIVELIDAANRALDRTAPWRIARADPAAAAAALYAPLEAARIAAGELSPFVPGVARTILARLGDADGAAAWGQPVSLGLCAGPPPLPHKQAG